MVARAVQHAGVLHRDVIEDLPVPVEAALYERPPLLRGDSAVYLVEGDTDHGPDNLLDARRLARVLKGGVE